nr:MAG TPA: hypothetical protein [Caudoviricetes sp.]
METALSFSESHRGPYVQRIAVSGVGRKPILPLGSDGPVSYRLCSSVHADHLAPMDRTIALLTRRVKYP